jgi:hypothetical protein
MRWSLFSSRRLLLAMGMMVTTLVIAALATAQPQSSSEPVAPKQPTEAELFAALERTLTGATLVGNFTVTGREDEKLTAERYELQGVRHVEGELWLFQASIRYGEHDIALPLTLPVRWAGDTPVICVDKMGFPGLGTYTARVMIYADHYAGFWSGGDHGGHLFGVIERAQADDASPDNVP